MMFGALWAKTPTIQERFPPYISKDIGGFIIDCW